MKRIIALPGETIAQRDGVILINGKALTEDYATVAHRHLRDFAAITLGADSYYVLGDNREVACDSRDFGPLLRNEIAAKVVAVIPQA